MGWALPAFAFPSFECPTPQSFTIASSGSRSFDLSLCSNFGLTGVSVAPLHGTLTGVDPSTGNGDSRFTYVNNGDASASDTFTVLDDTNGSVVFNVTITLPTITIAPASLPAGTFGTAYSQFITSSGGTAPYSYAVTAGALPGGITLGSSGLLSGTPTSAGSFNFTVRSTDAGNFTGNRAYSWNIVLPPAPVAGAVSRTVAFGSSANSITLNLTGGAAVSVAIPGPASHGTTTISGTSVTYTPTAGYAGPDSFTYTATNAGGTAAPATVTVTVSPPTIAVGPTTIPAGTTGTAYSQSITASGGTAPYTFASTGGALPSGLTLSAGGTLSGTPTASGTFNITVTATDSSSGNGPFSAARAYSFNVGGPTITVAPATLPAGTAGTAYSQSITAGGGTAPYAFVISSGTPPTGVTLSASGTLSGTPTTSGSYNFTVRATDSTGGTGPFSGARAYSFNVTLAAPVAGATSATVAFGSSANTVTLNLSGGTAASVAIATAASHGSASASGTTITYTPTFGYGGADSFTYTATNASGTSAPATVTITVSPPTIAVAPASLPAGTTGTAYSQSVTASGGAAPYTFAVTAGAPPSGVSLSSSGTLSGTPTASGSYNFTVTATDSSGGTGPFAGARAYALNVAVAAPIAGPASATVAANSSANPIPLNLGGGTAASVAIATAASHGTASASGTTVTYTPTGGYSGPDSFTYTATNATGTSTPGTVTITVNPAVPIAGAVAATVTANTSANPIALNLSGGAATSVAVATLPGHGIASASGTTITYTPAAGYSGPDSFAYTATNVAGTSAPATASLTVSAVTLTLGPATLAVGTAGIAYSQNLTTSGGTGGYVYAVTSGALPAGVAIASGGTLSGAPAAAGVYAFTVQTTDSSTNTGSRSYSWTVSPAAPVAGAVSATVSANTSGNAISPNLTGGTAVSVAIASAAAHGTATASGTTIAYTPAAGYSGPDSFTYTATNVSGTSAAATVTLTVSTVALTLSPPTFGAATVGTAYSQVLTTSGGTPGYTYRIAGGALPDGLALAPGGALGGTPTTAGAYGFTVVTTDASTNTVSRVYALTVNPAAPVAGASSATVASNSAGNPVALVLTGGPATSVAVAGAASHGTAVASGTTIGYTPAAGYSGPDSFTYTATNATGTSAAATVTVTVSAVTLTVNPASLATGIAGTAFSQALTASGGTAPYSYAIGSGALPAGVTLGSDGTAAGTPANAGTYAFTIVATDSRTNAGSRAYAWVVNPALPTAGPVAATATANSGGNPVTLVLGGGAATGVAVATPPAHGTATASGVTIAYAPAAGYSGADSFTYTATNATGTSLAATVTVTVTAVTLTLGPTTLRAATVGTAFSQAFATSGGTSPIAYRIGGGALPAGMALSSAGVLSGAAAASGTYAFTVVATDAVGNTGSQAIAWLVSPIAPAPPPVVQTVASNASRVPMRLQLADTGALAVVVRTQPAHGVAVAQGFDLLYTPAARYTGPDTFTYSVTTPAGMSDPAPVTVTVSPLEIAIAPAALPVSPQGRAFSVALQASGGAAPYRFTTGYGTMPPGLALTAAGVLSGNPSAEGLYAFTIVATDADGVVQSRDYTMSVGRVERIDPTTQAAVIGIVSAQIAATERFADTLLDNVGRHLDQVGGTPDVCGDLVAVGVGAAGTAPATSVTPQRFASAPAGPVRAEAAATGEPACALAIPVWIGGTLQHGHASPGGAGNGFSTSGVTVGIDLPGPSGLDWGAVIDYGRDRTDSEGLAAGTRAHSLMLSLYGRVRPLPWLFVDGVAGGGRLAFSSRRPGDAAGADLTGDRNGTSWFGSIRLGSDLRHDAARLITYLRADFKSARLDAYSERGPADTALTFQAMRWTSRSLTAGARGSWDFPMALGLLSPGLDASFRRSGAGTQVQRLFYADLGADSQTYDLVTSAVPQSSATVTLGLKLRTRAGVVYAGEAGRSSGSAGLRQVGARAAVQFGF